MAEITENGFPPSQVNAECVFDSLLHEHSVEQDISININNLTSGGNSSDDEQTPPIVRRRIKRFSDSDSEVEADTENIQEKENVLPEDVTSNANISSESEVDIFPRKSRFRANSSSSDDGGTAVVEGSRIGNKRNKLQDKFKSLLSARSKAPDVVEDANSKKTFDKYYCSEDSDSGSGIDSIKQKIKEKSMLLKSGICDPDTSSDEGGKQEQEKKKKKNLKQRSTILTSPKPARMSAKQAMENMQKIKSESNRMLREKEVSLPYHRPKALSLKDIMSRRKTALSADGKALPVKMNSDQLKQYVKFLEQRNKDMMELCKSDTEDEETTENTEEQNSETCTAICNEPTENSNTKETKDNGNALPDVDVIDKTNEDHLLDLRVEVVPKEQDESISIVSEKDDAVMKEISDIVEADSVSTCVTNDESQLIDLHYETEKNQNTEDQEHESNSNDQLPNNRSPKKINNDIEESTSNRASESDVSDKENIDNDIETDKTLNEKQDRNILDTGNTDDKVDINKSGEFEDDFNDDFSDDDINMEDLETIIENAKNVTNSEDAVNSPMLIRDSHTLNIKPRLTGAPGMVIDLDGSNPGSRKLTGVELLKERFTYYAKLKTPEEKERERELKIKPGMQHLKLKQELEDQISEQRSLEWAKRLADEKQQQMEMDAVRGDQSDEDDIDKIEAKLEEKEKCKSSSESEEEDEEEEEICDVEDKPRKRNPMVDDEAEVSGDECDDETEEQDEDTTFKNGEVIEEAGDDNGDDEDQEESDESSDDTSDDEEVNQTKQRKGRILKAFEDSDDESSVVVNEDVTVKPASTIAINKASDSRTVKDSQDDVLPLAQTNKSNSEDLFASQASIVLPSPYQSILDGDTKISDRESSDLGTQTFSILNTNTPEQVTEENLLKIPDELDVICETQPLHESNMDDIVGMCSGKFTQTQNVIPAETQITESQCAMGDDVLALCTGKFYDNQFVSQTKPIDNSEISEDNLINHEKVPNKKIEEEKDLLDSILKEMDEPVNEKSKTKYIFDNATENEAVSFDAAPQVRKKFVIDSDDDSNVDSNKPARKKKLKKRKPEKRALQISDDEDDDQSQSEEEAIDYMSEGDDDGVERVVEYDSEENEVEVKPQNQKKRRKMAEFFEQEAELTSEDEWVGSGDEDEAGLDRMEREAGDDDTFHQGQLQRELGQIHMRDVLDQDKREVRLIQELLFEDGDLGEGHRQRKFRWKDLDGEDDTGAVPTVFGDSQEEEFESEEQWRKQRHEREVFLRNMQKEKETEDQNINIDRTTIIKANLCSKTMSSLLLEVKGAKIEETTTVVEKKATKEEPAPLSVFKQNYHGSLLSRGRGALARLAALALPLAADADGDKVATVGPSSNRNFVFAAVSPAAKEPKVTKRKADTANAGTPRLIKKLKTDDKQISKSSLLDHLRAL